MSDEAIKYSIPTIDQLETVTDTETMILELATLEPILGKPDVGDFWALELEVRRSLPYGETKLLEKQCMKIDLETGALTLDVEDFMLKIWDKLVVKCNPPELTPKRLHIIDAPTASAVLAFLYKWYKKRIPLEVIEEYKKK